MNKIIKFIPMLLLLLVLSGCSDKKESKETTFQDTTTEQKKETTIAQNDKESNSETSQKDESADINGQKISELNQIEKQVFANDKNIIVIWQESCPPCEIQLKAMNTIYNQYPDISFVGLGIAESKENFDKYLAEKEITFENFYIDPGLLEELSTKITTTPTILFLDKEGKEISPPIIGSQFNNNELDEATKRIEELTEKL